MFYFSGALGVGIGSAGTRKQTLLGQKYFKGVGANERLGRQKYTK